VAEALACGRPFFATCSLGGQEGFNLRFLERHRVGSAVPLEHLFDALCSLLSSQQELARMQARAWRLGCRDGADRIAAMAAAHAIEQRRMSARWAT
jgi:processive 1,2-diacylglycerol beta-glucosyltransferase